jgi:hypothetical protein
VEVACLLECNPPEEPQLIERSAPRAAHLIGHIPAKVAIVRERSRTLDIEIHHRHLRRKADRVFNQPPRLSSPRAAFSPRVSITTVIEH